MRRPRLGIRRRLRQIADLRYWLALRRLENSRSGEYRAYLKGQLRRTLSKRSTDPGIGAQVLVREVARRCRRGASVLCVGCRNAYELDRFRAYGLEPVGIDLFSQRQDIFVMDMHEILFPTDSFDAVYASHALEHSYDLGAALAEIGRVARDGAVIGVEVPVRHKGSDADLLEFSGIADLRARLGPMAERLLYEDEQPASTPTNAQGSAVARLVFRFEKAPSTMPAPARSRARTASRRPKLAATVAAACVLVVTLFGLMPEALDDWPYNVLGHRASGAPTAHARATEHRRHADAFMSPRLDRWHDQTVT